MPGALGSQRHVPDKLGAAYSDSTRGRGPEHPVTYYGIGSCRGSHRGPRSGPRCRWLAPLRSPPCLTLVTGLSLRSGRGPLGATTQGGSVQAQWGVIPCGFAGRLDRLPPRLLRLLPGWVCRPPAIVGWDNGLSRPTKAGAGGWDHDCFFRPGLLIQPAGAGKIFALGSVMVEVPQAGLIESGRGPARRDGPTDQQASADSPGGGEDAPACWGVSAYQPGMARLGGLNRWLGGWWAGWWLVWLGVGVFGRSP